MCGCYVILLLIMYILQGVIKACEALKERLEKVKKELEKEGAQNPSWLDVVTKAYLNGVDLSSKYL